MQGDILWNNVEWWTVKSALEPSLFGGVCGTCGPVVLDVRTKPITEKNCNYSYLSSALTAVRVGLVRRRMTLCVTDRRTTQHSYWVCSLAIGMCNLSLRRVTSLCTYTYHLLCTHICLWTICTLKPLSKISMSLEFLNATLASVLHALCLIPD